ncbi:hypothetical protein NW768_005896 [Fusarium equiseti]|uniref:Uncharacterized protein n=1 Tax=Fusarium equiseti TaxID=61235 RepID=A0ABQ8RD89_FUSEQ|nr:hypothetical protein NW768_005896 [Fusarium equiseti]
MDSFPGQGFNEESSSQHIDGPDDITLCDYHQWQQGEPTPWELREDELNLQRESNLSVRQWLQRQDNSRPAQDTFINSQSSSQRKRETQKLLFLVDGVLGGTKSLPADTAKSSINTTTLAAQNTTTLNIDTTSTNQPSLAKSAFSAHPFSLSSASDRGTTYYGNGYHSAWDSGTSVSQSHSAFPITSHGHQTRGRHNQVSGPSLPQSSWSVTGTDTSTGSKKPPKRQSSRSADDETSSKRTFSRRNVSRVNNQPCRRPPPSTSGPAQTAPPDGNLLLQTSIGGMRGSHHRLGNNTSSLSSESTSFQTTQFDGSLSDHAGKGLSHDDFNDVCEICPFWLLDPILFSNIERPACSNRKEEMSHIITHLIDHHGLVRGNDPKNASRKYLASCQTYSPSVKAKGNCPKCSSLHQWKDSGPVDPKHNGVVLCMRCWSKFDKDGMQDHLAGPLCPYKAEQPKPKKMCILYTTFCSNDKPPSPPPRDMQPRKANHRTTPRKHSRRNVRQQASSRVNRHPAPTESSQPPQPPLSRPPSSQSQPFSFHEQKRDTPSSREFHESENRQPVSETSSTRRPTRHPIPLAYPDTAQEYTVGNYETIQTHEQQSANRSTHPSTTHPNSFENIKLEGTMFDNGFQYQPQLQVQNTTRLPSQYQNWQQFLQVPQTLSQPILQTLGQNSLRDVRDSSFDQFSLQSSSQPQHPQLSSSQCSLQDSLSRKNQQQSPGCANLSAYNNRSSHLLHHPKTPRLQLQVPAMDDLDATISLSGGLSHVQSSPSRVPSTAGESMDLLQSPNIEGSMWLFNDNFDYDNSSDWLNMGTIGSHPQLQESIEIGDPPTIQSQQRLEDLNPNSGLLTVQQAAVEKDSAYHSDAFHDMEWDDEKNIFS